MPVKIFYVEDSPGEVFLLQEAVRTLNENVQLVTADDGEVALRLLLSASVQPCVIVLDLDLPGIDGTQSREVPPRTQGYSNSCVRGKGCSQANRDEGIRPRPFPE